MSGFQTPIDILNRGYQLIRVPRIARLDDLRQGAVEGNFAYDKLRVAELERNLWRMSTKTSILYPVDTTTQIFAPAAWASGTTYAAGAIVADTTGQLWTSLVGSNTGNPPGTIGASFWDHYFGPLYVDAWGTVGGSTVTPAPAYWAGDLVIKSGTVYRSLINSNSDTPPTSNWLAVGSGLNPVNILYPLGAGPLSQPATRNIFPLPYGFLREAPQEPKSNTNAYLGAHFGSPAVDWMLQDTFLVSSDAEPIYYRYVADLVLVSTMTNMFCEGLAARCAQELAPLLVDDPKERTQAIARATRAYTKVMREARLTNDIELSSVAPPQSRYITVRY